MFIEVFRALASRQRIFCEMQLAAGVEPESNLLQVDPCNPAKCSHAAYGSISAVCERGKIAGYGDRDVASHIRGVIMVNRATWLPSLRPHLFPIAPIRRHLRG